MGEAVELISRALTLVVVTGLLAVVTAPHVTAQAVPTSGHTELAPAPHSSTRNEARAALGPSTVGILPVCNDPAFRLAGGHWTRPVHWTFMSSSTPASLGVATTESVLVKSFNNITGAHNDCGRQDKVGAQNVYDGRSDRSPGVTRVVKCARGDGHNVIGFGRLPRGILAATCTRRDGNRIVEADIRINTRYAWALSAQSCNKQELLEPTITHEVGHVYGLDHVSERGHPLMTMSRSSDGPCNNAASTLGLGDMLGLEALY